MTIFYDAPQMSRNLGGKIMRALIVAAFATLVAGCETINSALPYQASAQNVIGLQTVFQDNQRIQVSPFSVAQNVNPRPPCRGVGPIEVAAGKSVGEYVQEALQQELLMAGVYDGNAAAILSGQIDRLQLNPWGISEGSWDIALSVSMNNGESFQVQTHFPYASSFSADYACRNAANAFPSAVQALLREVYQHPKFRALATAPAS